MSAPALRVPFVDLRASLEPIRAELMSEIERILDGMELLLGPRQRAFEEEFARYCEAPHGVAVSSGTDALVAGLLACGLGPGDEVICPAHTFFATVEAVLHTGAVPVLVDVEPDTLTLDPAAVRGALTSRTRALLPVHLYGHPADMEPLLEIAAQHGLRVVEDAAQAHGARYRGRRCGSLGDAACFSFYFAKSLGALGEAGFVATRDRDVAQRVRLLRDHGRVSRFEHAVLGANRRMDEIQAAVLRLKLPHLDRGNARRREIAERYRKLLDGLALGFPARRDGCEPVHQVFPVRLADRDGLREHLTRAGIGSGIHYPLPAHRQPALRGRPHRCGPTPETERACAELLSLPVYPELRDEQVQLVADEVRRFLTGA